MGLTKEIYQEQFERDQEIEAKQMGLSLDDYLILKAEEEAQEQEEMRRAEEEDEFVKNFQNI